MKSTTMHLKQLNIDRIKMAMQKNVIVTKNSLSQITGLSVATCGNILRKLIASGEIIELPFANSTGGRPSKQFKYNKEFGYLVSIYIRIEADKKSLCIIISNLFGEEVSETVYNLNNISLADIDNELEKAIEKYCNILAVSIGIPTVVADGKTSSINELTKLSNINIKEHIKTKFKLPSIIENDVNITALGYFNSQFFGEDEPLVYLYYPKNNCPGAGLILNGQIFKGFSNFAGEVSCLPFNSNKDHLNQKVLEKSLYHIIHTTSSIISIINPKTIVLSGLEIDNELLLKAKNGLKKYIPSEHIPNLLLRQDFHQDCKRGLKFLATELLRCDIKIIER